MASSDSSMNDTVDENLTFWRSSEESYTSFESQSYSFATVSHAKATVFWTIFVIGVIGNLLVIAVGVIGHRRGKKGQTLVTRMFICCLAISDLGLMLTTTWSNAMLAIVPTYSYGSFFCKLTSLWTSVSAKSSVTMLSVIAVDRSATTCSIY